MKRRTTTDYPQKTWRDYAAEPGYYYDEDAANRIIDFTEELCTHVKGEWGGKPIMLEEWQKDQIFRPAFGIKREADGLRRFRRAWIELPRKNGKTLITVPPSLYMLGAAMEAGAEVYCVAAEKEQARLLHDVAKAMISNNKKLSSAFKPYQNSITHKKSNSFFRVLSADADTKHGFNVFFAAIDEVHVHRTLELTDVIQTGTGSRREPMVFYITTAGVAGSPAHKLHIEADEVLRGEKKDDALLPIIYGACEGDDPFDEAVWAKANPNLGISKYHDYMAGEATKARNRPSYLNTFRQLDLNIWTDSLTAWLTDELLNRASGENPPVANLQTGLKAWIGIDLAFTDDIASVQLHIDDGGTLRIYTYAWIPEESVTKKAKNEQVDLRPWIDAGYMRTVPGSEVDFAFIEREIADMIQTFDVLKVGYDKYQARDMVQRLEHRFGADMFMAVAQTCAGLDYPTRTFESALASGTLCHGDNPVWTWAAGNCELYTSREGKVMVSKKSNRRKIDPIVASINATAAMIAWKGDEGANESHLDREGELFSF